MTSSVPHCLNCDAPLNGAYCSQCGQQVRDADVSLRELLHEAAETFTNVDGAGLRSFVGLLWPPGRFTRDYLAGRRARYLPPLRLYLLCSLAFVLTREVRDWTVGEPRGALLNVSTTIERDDGTTTVIRGDSAVRMLLDSAGTDTTKRGGILARLVRGAFADPVAFRERVRANAPRAFFVLVPAFAWLLGIAFRTQGAGPFGRQLLVAMHLHAAGFLFFAAGHLITSVPGLRWELNPGLIVTLLFAPAALQRIYDVPLGVASFRFLLVALGYLNVVALATVVVIGFAALA